MKNFSYSYKGKELLIDYIEEQKISEYESVLVQVFCCEFKEIFMKEIIDNIKIVLPEAVLLGVFTQGNIVDTIETNSIIINFSVFDKTQIEMGIFEGTDDYLTGKNIVQSLVKSNTKLFLLYSTNDIQGSSLLEGINEVNNCVIVSGAIVEGMFIEEKVKKNLSTIAIAFSSYELDVWTDTLCGWQGVGPLMTVTEANKNEVISLDNINIKEIYNKYLGLENKENEYIDIIKMFPLRRINGAMRYSRCATRETENGLEFIGNFHIGETVKLSYFNMHTWREVINIVLNIYFYKNIESCFLFYGRNRHEILKDNANLEIGAYRFITDSLVGLISKGEYFYSPEYSESYVVSGSCTLLMMTENNIIVDKVKRNIKEMEDYLSNIVVKHDDNFRNLIDYVTSIYDFAVDEINKSEDALMEQERLIALGHLMGGIAHNINTPLAGMGGQLFLANRSLEKIKNISSENDNKMDSIKNYVEDLLKYNRNINEYLNYISDVIKAVKNQVQSNENIKYNKFIIQELFDKVLILMKMKLKQSHVDLYINIQEELSGHYITGELTTLIQIIINIIENSIDSYSGKNGIINLEAKIEPYTHERYRFIKIDIQDFGCGITEEIKPKLFKKMITTKGKNGTGIGLYLSNIMIKAKFKGRIECYSEKNKGTTMSIYILMN